MNLHGFLPASVVGTVESVQPIHTGLSGAAVHAVVASRGEFILRIQGARADRSFHRLLLVQRRAAEAGVAPAVVYVDKEAGAVLSVRIPGATLPAALGDPVSRGAAIGSVVDRLRVLHALDPSGIDEVGPVPFARAAFEGQRHRAGFPDWADGIGATLDAIAGVLAHDERVVVSHNDLNPGNVLWDGTRAWLVDWEVAGLTHPYYDLAALTTFLNMEAEPALQLLAAQEGSAPDAAQRATFAALRSLVPLAIGCTFLSLVPDLTALGIPALGDVMPLAEFYAERRAGRIDMYTPAGQRAYGLAMLRRGVEAG